MQNMKPGKNRCRKIKHGPKMLGGGGGAQAPGIPHGSAPI